MGALKSVAARGKLRGMCGRFVVAVPDLTGLGTRFFVKRGRIADWAPRYNLAPTQLAPAITNEPERRMALFRFGLVPSWAKQLAAGNNLINARSETVATLASYRDAYLRRRCIVPVTGYYEWRKLPGEKTSTPFLIRRKDGDAMPLAGVWESWTSPEGQVVESFSLLTRDAQGFLRDIHDRMPVALREDDVEAWLSPKPRREPGIPAAPDLAQLEMLRVSPLVNSPKNDVPECIVPLSEAEQAAADHDKTAQLDLFLQAHPRR